MALLLPAFLATGLLILSSPTDDSDWKRFRGPNGSGVIEAKSMPEKLDPGANARWRTPLRPGFSSPVLTAKHVFVTAYEEKKLYTICLDRESGEILWEKEAPKELPRLTRGYNSPVSATPVTDGENVYVFFESSGLVSYDAQGEERWKLPLGPFKNPYGMANSPILVDGLLVLQADQDAGSYLLAVDAATGEERWKVERPLANHGFSSPIVHRPAEGPAEIVVLSSFELVAYSAAKGEKLWFLPGLAWQAKSVPVLDGETLYVHSWMENCQELGIKMEVIPPWKEILASHDEDGDGRLSRKESPDETIAKYWPLFDLDKNGYIEEADWNNLIARSHAQNGVYRLQLGGSGDLTKSIAWRYDRSLQNVPSPLLYQGVLYLLKEGGILTALNPEDGEVLKRGRVCDGGDDYYASPVAAAGKIYTASKSGIVTVLKAGAELEKLFTHDFEEEIWSTPALAPERVYLRTQKALYCF